MTCPLIRPRIFDPYPEVCAAASTRLGGVSRDLLGLNLSFRVGDDPAHVRENRSRFFCSAGIDETSVAIPQQVHGTDVRHIAAAGDVPACDALVTSANNLALVVTIADCVPILLYDPRKHACAAVHAGWRGSASGIVVRAVEHLIREFGTRPEDLLAWIGPSAGPCCYNVGADVARKFDRQERAEREGKHYLDLKSANARHLREMNVPADHLEQSTRCTICDLSLHSFRRDGEKSGRMMAVISIHSSERK